MFTRGGGSTRAIAHGTQPIPQRVERALLVEVLVRTVIKDDVKLSRQRHAAQLLRIGRVRLEREVHARIVPHRIVVLAAKLRLVLDEPLGRAARLGALAHLAPRLDVDRIDVRVRKVGRPRLHRRRGVLAAKLLGG